MNEAEKTAIRQECRIRLIDKSTPFWTSLLKGIAINANHVSESLINYLCPASFYDAVYKFRGITLEKSRIKSDIVSFKIYKCPMLERKNSGEERNDVKIHFLCIITFNDGTQHCFDLQIMWKGNYHSPPFFILFEIDCNKCRNYDKTSVMDGSSASGGGWKKGGSRRHKRKTLRRRKTRRRK
jgi:hypothetical protein